LARILKNNHRGFISYIVTILSLINQLKNIAMVPLSEELKKQDIVDQLTWDDSVNANAVHIDVMDNIVRLTGKVPNYLAKMAAERDAYQVAGVANVENYLEVEFPPTITRLTDDEIISKNIYERYFNDIYGPKPSNGQVSDYWKSCSVLHLVETTDPEKLKSIRFYIDCGDDDFLYKGNSTLHIKMRDLGIPHEYRVRDGSHQWSYWRTGLHDGLIFISEKFHR